MSKYTYVTFADEVITLANGGTVENLERLIEKATALKATHENKATYNKANPKKSTAKGASAETMAKAEQIAEVLPTDAENAVTAAEINELIGTEFSALQVANAIKFIENATSVKVVRSTTGKNGLTAEKMYTAYYKA
jgi:hypothetical protein